MISKIGCSKCGNKIFTYLEDRDMGDYDVEIYECNQCHVQIKIELPD